MSEFFTKNDFVNCYKVEDFVETANRIIRERGRVVYGDRDPSKEGEYEWAMFDVKKPTNGQTHTALLINIEPIAKPDSAEQILQELIVCPQWEGPINALRERARKLLEGK